MRRTTGLLCSFLLLSIAACGGDDDNAGNPDAFAFSDAALTDAPRADAKTGDGNDSFDEAKDIMAAGQDGISDAIGKPGDRDYYYADLTAGTWFTIGTQTDTGNGDPDTAMIMYKADKATEVAKDDDAWPWQSTDSEIVIKVPETARYYFEVGEYSDLVEGSATPVGEPGFSYTIVATTIAANAITTIDAEGGDDAASAAALSLQDGSGSIPYKYGFVLGDYKASGTDVDVFSFTVPAPSGTARPMLDVIQMPMHGSNDYGSDTCAGKMWITTQADTSTVIARVDGCQLYTNQATESDWSELQPPMAEGDYYLWLEKPASTSGSNLFYVLKFFLFSDGDNAPETEPNDDPATEAMVITMSASPTTSGQYDGFVMSKLEPPGTDVDWFKFNVPAANQVVSVACGSKSSGSGVEGLKVGLYSDPSGAALKEATETVLASPLAQYTATSSGDFYVKVEGASQSTEATANFARCGFHYSAPAP